MLNITIYFIALIITFPIIATFLLYWLAAKLFKHRLKAVHFAVNWTTLIYIVTDLILIFLLFGLQLTGILFIILLILLAVIMIIQWKVNTDVQFFKALKILWRICCLVFFLLYIWFVFYQFTYFIGFYYHQSVESQYCRSFF